MWQIAITDQERLEAIAQAILEQFIKAKLILHFKETNIQTHLEEGTYEQYLKHLGCELEVNDLQSPDGQRINRVNQPATTSNLGNIKRTCHY